MKPFISLCMIVKNEEKVLERCLGSVFNLVDEIIVVDTGSTDCTKEIASKYTEKIYDFEWVNDFSAARNYAASKATGEWILVLDADEYVDKENFNQFVKELKDDNGAYDAYTAKIINFTGNYGENIVQNFHDRIYKNNGEISYYRHIHELFKSNNNKPLKIKNSSLLIFHSGYLYKTVKEKNKNGRNKQLLELEMNSEEKNAFDYFNIGNEYSSIGEYEKALESYLKAYKQKSDFRLAWVSNTVVQIIVCLINLKRYNDAIKIINDAQNIYISSPEFPYLKGEICFLRGQLDDAKQIFHQIINNENKYNYVIQRPDLKDQKPHIRLGEIYLFEKDYQNSVFHFTSVLNLNKYDKKSISKIIYLLNKLHTYKEIAEFLKSKELVNKKNIKNYVRACFDVGNPLLAIKLLEDYVNEYNLLNKVALLKNFCINNVGNIELFIDICNPEILKELLKSNWINIVDILLLRNYISMDSILPKITSSLNQNEHINKLIDFMDGTESIVNIDGDLLAHTLDILFVYKKYELCNVILENIEKANKNTILKVARVLFANDFKGEALQLYSFCDWNLFNEQDFINIIDSLLITNNKDTAIKVANYAMVLFEENFRFYKCILENTEDINLFKQTLKKANKIFSQSDYLESLFKNLINELESMNEFEERERFILMALETYPDREWLRNEYLKI